MSETTLQQLQDWMKTIITTRGDLKQKLQQAEEQFNLNIGDAVEAKRGVSAERRMDIYASGYVLRLLDCMKCDFPGLQAFMGEDLFDVFAKAYIVSLPSQSWSLYVLTERFPDFLRATEPENKTNNEQQQNLIELPAEIATFERTRAELSIAKGTEGEENPNQPETDITDYLLGHTIIQSSPTLRLLKQKFPLNEFLNELAKGNNPVLPERKTTYVAFSRKDYRIRITELEQWQYEFLNACKDPVSIHECAVKASEVSRVDVKTILANLMVWLPVVVEMRVVKIHIGT